jgi:hypothetical protein
VPKCNTIKHPAIATRWYVAVDAVILSAAALSSCIKTFIAYSSSFSDVAALYRPDRHFCHYGYGMANKRKALSGVKHSAKFS